ncbi:osteopetrosis-associated transmembrane protein 1-like isoform X2 [Denticeps clupeoides]|uniref:osteopetrosis-associated transmembrane protein 1-like isoform X2 n=1 Tax=Denticeps clupeoides TaxID=299321 RepID=UPI0010A3A68C|nr:osteopetrosis-associated transmembrane protein 1-like isoform X2 [Denticeps clupeoides]
MSWLLLAALFGTVAGGGRASTPLLSLSLSSAFPEQLEFSDVCLEMLRVFGRRYVTYADCLVSHARPVRICQSCYSKYSSLREVYANMSSDQLAPGNVSCNDELLRADRLMLLYKLYSNLEDIWGDNPQSAYCSRCLTEDLQGLNSQTLHFFEVLNQTLGCFEKYQQMNVTRHLWSKMFSCAFPREETVPVLAVSSFMVFLPIIFYLSSFLHSEQKKRKLIHPKRVKSNHSLMNIQDRFN